MTTYKVHEAKSQLSKLISEAEAGHDVYIARGARPAVKLVALNRPRKARVPGIWAGAPDLPDSFFFETFLGAWDQ